MARTITQYRIFIGSPGGLVAERKLFRDTVAKFNTRHARQHQIEFEAVGWEDTLPGVGRPQEKINEDLEQCDYAIFAFNDRWGSTTGKDGLVGTEEEWQIAQRLYGEYKLRQMALFFKAVPPAQEKDPGEEYKKVLAFKRQIFDGKKHLCGSFKKPRDFGEMVEKHLAQWLADHIKTPGDGSLSEPQSQAAQDADASVTPNFVYWHDEAWKVMEGPSKDYSAGLIFANRAVDTGWSEGFENWRAFSQSVETFPTGFIVNGGSVRDLSPQEMAAYDAPFPDERYKAGARQFPTLVPVTSEHASIAENLAAWEVLERFARPVLTCFSDKDPVTNGGEKQFIARIPGAAGQPHTIITDAGHFLQEDKPEVLIALIDDFIAAG